MGGPACNSEASCVMEKTSGGPQFLPGKQKCCHLHLALGKLRFRNLLLFKSRKHYARLTFKSSSSRLQIIPTSINHEMNEMPAHPRAAWRQLPLDFSLSRARNKNLLELPKVRCHFQICRHPADDSLLPGVRLTHSRNRA